jgi:hypothetical protein
MRGMISKDGTAGAEDVPIRHRDTPPEEIQRVAAGLLARGSSLPSSFPARERQWNAGRKLAAHSCGGSSGLTQRAHRIPS